MLLLFIWFYLNFWCLWLVWSVGARLWWWRFHFFIGVHWHDLPVCILHYKKLVFLLDYIIFWPMNLFSSERSIYVHIWSFSLEQEIAGDLMDKGLVGPICDSIPCFTPYLHELPAHTIWHWLGLSSLWNEPISLLNCWFCGTYISIMSDHFFGYETWLLPF